MSTAVDGLPDDLVAADLSERSVSMRVDATLYPLSALYGAAYIFIDRAFVLLDKPSDAFFRVTLSWKKGDVRPEDLRQLVGEFANELLSCAWRAKINEESRAIVEAVTAQALAGAMGPPNLDDLAKFDFTEDPLDDPLGIAVSWEEKYAKNRTKPAEADAALEKKP